MARRKHERFTKRCEVEFVANETTYKGKSSNFSMNGFFIRTNHPLEPDTILHIVIYLPDGLTSKVRGKIIRAIEMPMAIRSAVGTLKNGMGVEIIEKDSHYINFIKSFHNYFNQT
ncbi:MAG: PilZ domain-containing protein [Thermodesulfovibrionia bacterium]|nr:PilZ domain-containing protein [Thermodesulfovibrionia bacterium]MCK5286213.1 PilZ domain-containing protein [Thermodesulfovibrionia bacterium]